MYFSIIIPTLNETQTILPLLTSLQHLRSQAEIILVDGGSWDDTVKQASEWVNKSLISAQGRARQMNLGARNAQGDVLVFLHADTYLPDNALSLIQDSIKAGFVWGRFDINLTGRNFMLRAISFLMNQRSRLTGIATGDQTIFVASRTFFEAGTFPDIALMEDIALSRTLKKWSKPACIAAKVTSSARRWEQFGLVKTILLMWNLRWRYFMGENPDILAQMYTRGCFWKT